MDDLKPCIEWTGAIQSRGYGHLVVDGKHWLAHRYAYTQAKGDIQDGLVIDHLCKNVRCLNPEHLEAVTQWKNNARGDSPTAKNMKKTHCALGHDLETFGKIVVRPDGTRRKCKECDRIYAIKRRRNKHV